jgi:hypothetical protein
VSLDVVSPVAIDVSFRHGGRRTAQCRCAGSGRALGRDGGRASGQLSTRDVGGHLSKFGEASMQHDVRIVRTLAQPPVRVWRALSRFRGMRKRPSALGARC